MKKKSGFTVVELVIVIAIIAILASVLIPTFSSLVRKANLSSDEQLMRNMNQSLAAAEAKGNRPGNPAEVKVILCEAGIDAVSQEVAKPQSKGYLFAWNPEDNRIHMVKDHDSLGEMYDLSIEYKPPVEPTDRIYETVKDLTNFKCFVLYQGETLTLTDDVAKKLYVTVCVGIDWQSSPPELIAGDVIQLTFYDSSEEYTPSTLPGTVDYYGAYSIASDNSVQHSSHPYVSFALYLRGKTDLYASVLATLSQRQ